MICFKNFLENRTTHKKVEKQQKKQHQNNGMISSASFSYVDLLPNASL